MAKKLILGLILALLAQICPTPTPHPQFYLFILPLLDVRHCCKLSLCAISRKTNKPNMRKWQKPIFRPNFGPFGLKSGHHFFFFKNLALSVTRYHGQLSSCTISEKTNDPILRIVSERWTDRQTVTDRRTRVISKDAVWLTSKSIKSASDFTKHCVHSVVTLFLIK